MENEKIRIQKYISECGIASRRKAEELITSKRVTVNGKVAGIGDKIDVKSDIVCIDGKKVVKKSNNVYIMLHKPRGFITTMSDEMGRKCIAELIKDVPERVYPIGRLDKDSEGLLLLTNDGEFANAIMHPKRHVSKTYRVTVRPSVTEEQIDKMSTGIMIDGRKTAPAEVKIITEEENRVVLNIVLFEGRNREIRKMCEELDLEVAKLKRIAIANVKLGMLQRGKWRELTPAEIMSLKRRAGLLSK